MATPYARQISRVQGQRTRGGQQAGAPAPLRIAITPLGLFACLCGAFAAVKINLVGELFLTELLLVLVAIAAAVAGGARKLSPNRLFWLLLAAGMLSLAGYIVSDLYRGTPPDLYFRGWARTLFILISFVALSLLFSADRRNLWWFALGVGIGSLLYFKFVMRLPIGDITNWKFAYAQPTTLFVACVGAVLPIRATALLVGILGMFSIFKDYRIHGAVCVLVGTLMWTASAGKSRVSPALLLKVGAAGLAGIVAVSVLLSMSTSGWHEQRRDASNEGRLLGFKLGMNAITASPVIGYGSWGRNEQLIRIGLDTIARHNETAKRPIKDRVVISAHSQLLNAWIEGGLLGASLYFLLLALLLREGYLAVLRRPGDLLTPLVLFILLMQVWHLTNSPLGAGLRLFFATAMAVLVVLYAERKTAERVGRGVPTRNGWRPGRGRIPIMSPHG